MSILQIVDDVGYIKMNCYQRQLYLALTNETYVTLLTYEQILSGRYQDVIKSSNVIVSTLKMRTADRIRNELGKALNGRPIVFYCQDPFENFRDDGQFSNAYFRINGMLNIRCWVVTVKQYADLMNSIGLPTKFEHIWMLPQYCVEPSKYTDRKIDVAFMGTMYPWRQKMIDQVTDLGVNVTIEKNSYTYDQYLNMLRDVKIFLCSHDSKLVINGKVQQYRHGMYHKDIEVASQGCFSISDSSPESSTYIDHKRMKSIMLYHDVKQIPDIIDHIQKMDPEERQEIICETVECIKEKNYWQKTAETLVNS